MTGAAKDEIISIAHRVLAADPMGGVQSDRPVYPDLNIVDPIYNERRKRVGEMMYAKVGIPKEDRAGRIRWFANNYQFFGAPVGLFLIIDRRMGHGQWAHMGMYMQTIALLAEERGWATCMQECWARIRPELAGISSRRTPHGLCRHLAGRPRSGRSGERSLCRAAPQGEVVEFKGF